MVDILPSNLAQFSWLIYYFQSTIEFSSPTFIEEYEDTLVKLVLQQYKNR